MKCLGEQHVFPTQSVVSGGKFEFGERKGVAQVQHAVHVRVGEIPEPFTSGRWEAVHGGVGLEDLGGGPFGLGDRLILEKRVSALPALKGKSTGEVGRGGGEGREEGERKERGRREEGREREGREREGRGRIGTTVFDK